MLAETMLGFIVILCITSVPVTTSGHGVNRTPVISSSALDMDIRRPVRVFSMDETA